MLLKFPHALMRSDAALVLYSSVPSNWELYKRGQKSARRAEFAVLANRVDARCHRIALHRSHAAVTPTH